MRFSTFGGRAGICARVTSTKIEGLSGPGEDGSGIYEMASSKSVRFGEANDQENLSSHSHSSSRRDGRGDATEQAESPLAETSG